MLRILLTRGGQSLIAVVLASMAIFALIRFIPGDPAVTIAGTDANPEVLAEIRAEHGLDRPIPVQYGMWVRDVLTGDLGDSYTARRPVTELIGPTILPTILLLAGGVLIAIVIALLLGAGASVPQKRGLDALLMGVAALLYGAPVFWIGLVFILVFAVSLKWLPASGYVAPGDDLGEAIKSLVLPWLVLGLAMGASLSRFVRSSFNDVLESDFIRLARAKGMSTTRVVRKHVFRNALIPIITVFGVAFAGLLGGAVVIEQVFTWPGLGSLMLNSVNNRDYPTVQAIMLIYVVAFIAVNLITDISYSIIDPRIRVTGATA